MKIIETKYSNVTKSNIDQNKEFLANSIMKTVYPLFNEVYSVKKTEILDLRKKLEKKKEVVQHERKQLEMLIDEYKKKKKLSKLLDRIEKLVTSGLVYDGALKHETVILLKVIDKLSEEKIDKHLQETLRTISKRFAR